MIRRIGLPLIVLGCVCGGSFSRVSVGWGQGVTIEQPLAQLQQQIAQQRGLQLYRRACTPCHGSRGDGQGPAAKGLQPKPHDFTRGVFKFRTTPVDAMPTDADLLRTISEGIPGTAMPAWKRLLSEQQRSDLVQYIKTFATEKFAAAAQTPVEPLHLPPAPPPTPDSITQGQQLYERLQCWQCHGHSGAGDGPLAAVLRDIWNRPIRPQDFTKGVYKSGQQPEDLLRTVLTGLSGTPMPSFSTSISVDEGWHLVHYVRALGRAKNLWNYVFVDTGQRFPGR